MVTASLGVAEQRRELLPEPDEADELEKVRAAEQVGRGAGIIGRGAGLLSGLPGLEYRSWSAAPEQSSPVPSGLVMVMMPMMRG